MAVTEKKKNWNVFLVNDYEKLRPLLRLLSYGCYSVKDIRQALGKSQSFISHWNGYLTNILPDDRASISFIKGCVGTPIHRAGQSPAVCRRLL